MRLFEVLFLLSCLLLLAWQWRPIGWAAGAPAWARALALLALPASLALHLLLEQPRWQMAPLYLLGAILLGRALARRQTGRAGLVVLLTLLLLAALPPLLLPVPRLPAPGGPYPVGSSVFEWVDPTREEIYPSPAGLPRRILVQVWYPASPADGTARREPYLRDSARLYPAIAEQMFLPAFTFSHLALARTHAFSEAPAAPGAQVFPVLVFSHGWTGFRNQNTFQMEMLASHGYIVFSADHTYGAAAVAFPGGDLVLNHPQALPKGAPDDEYDRVSRRLGQSFVGDIRFVLDQAARLQSGEIPSPITGKLDLAQVGVLGHSTGAGAALETCFVDARCQAALAMDPWLIPYDRALSEQGLSQPLMSLHSASWRAYRNPPLVEQLFANQRGPVYRLRLAGSSHYTFTDVDLFMPLIARLRAGRLFGPTHLEQINAYSLAFFDQYLKNQPSPLLQPGAQPGPGIENEIGGQ